MERLYPGRKFTPAGHMVGSIGEVIAAEHFGLTLLSPSHPGHDATDADGRLVQIKLTAGSSIGGGQDAKERPMQDCAEQATQTAIE